MSVSVKNITNRNFSAVKRTLARITKRQQPESHSKIWPQKYEAKHEMLKEIPRDCVMKLLTEIDNDMDGKISLKELIDFIERQNNTKLSVEKAKSMFQDISNRRGVTFKSQLSSPITLDELALCCNLFLQ